jgi:hypothetical protein
MFNRCQFIRNKYLLNCDLISKYNQKNSKTVPYLKKIKITFPLINFKKSLRLRSVNIDNNMIQTRIYTLFYLFSGYNPMIKIKKTQALKEKKSFVEFFIVIILSTKSDLDKFLFSIFIENFFFFEKEKLNFFKNDSKIQTFKNLCDVVTLNKTLPFCILSEIELLSTMFFPNINPKDLLFNIHFLFQVKNVHFLLENVSFFRNNLYFWVLG